MIDMGEYFKLGSDKIDKTARLVKNLEADSSSFKYMTKNSRLCLKMPFIA
jgi:hypothetical protein